MDFYNKYLKYKSKYLGLKNNLSFLQNGGALGTHLDWESAVDFGKKCNDSSAEKPRFPRDLNLSGWLKTDIKVNDKNLEVIKKSFEETGDKPILVAMGGISTNSFCGSSEIIVQNVELLKDKFKAIYIINTNEYKKEQGKACDHKDAITDGLRERCKFMKEKENDIRRKMKENIKDKDEYRRYYDKLYGPEREFTNNLAQDIHNLIKNKLKLTNVHLLGKCQGGSNMLSVISTGDEIYKALYLAVPGAAYNIEPLYNLTPARLEDITFIFGWNKNDDYGFGFNISINEKAVYDEEIGKLEEEKKVQLNYESYVFTPGNGHEINSKLIAKIAKA